MSDRAPSPPPAADYSPPADGGPYASTIYAMYGPAPLAPPPRAATASPPPQPPQAATASPPPQHQQEGVRDTMVVEINGKIVAEPQVVMDLTSGRVHSVVGWELCGGVCALEKEAALIAVRNTLAANPSLRPVT